MRQRGGLPAWVFWLMFAGLIAEITTILLLIPEADMSIEETPCTESLADLTGQSELPQVKAEPPVKTQCTESEGHSMRCLNPLCNNPVTPRQKHAPAKFYCGGPCKQTGALIKRVSKLLNGLSDDEVLRVIRG